MKYPIVFLAFLTLASPVFGQNADYAEYQVGQLHVNDFKISPNGKSMIYNVVRKGSTQYESEFYARDLVNGTEEVALGKSNAFIQGWQDNEHVVLASEDGSFIIQNIFTKSKTTVKNPAGVGIEPLYISKDKMVFCDEGVNQPTYHIYENGKLSKSLKGTLPLIINSFDVATKSIIEIYPSQTNGEVDVYQFDFAANERKVIATLALDANSIILDATLKGDELYYIIEKQIWNEVGHLWQSSRGQLYAYNLTTKRPSFLYQFVEGMEALNLEIASKEEYFIVFKDHYNDGTITYDRNEKENGDLSGGGKSVNAKEINSSMFAAIASKFRSTLSATSIIGTIDKLDKDYPNIYIKGPELAKSMSHLSAKNQAILSSKVEKLIISGGNVTVKLKPNVTHIKISQKSKKGKTITVKLKQGASIKFTKRLKTEVSAQIKGTSLWMAVQYASIGAITLKGDENTLNVFTKMGVGFWTSHKMGVVRRRVK